MAEFEEGLGDGAGGGAGEADDADASATGRGGYGDDGVVVEHGYRVLLHHFFCDGGVGVFLGFCAF